MHDPIFLSPEAKMLSFPTAGRIFLRTRTNQPPALINPCAPAADKVFHICICRMTRHTQFNMAVWRANTKIEVLDVLIPNACRNARNHCLFLAQKAHIPSHAPTGARIARIFFAAL